MENIEKSNSTGLFMNKEDQDEARTDDIPHNPNKKVSGLDEKTNKFPKKTKVI